MPRTSTGSRRRRTATTGPSAKPRARTIFLAGVGISLLLAVAAVAFVVVRSGGSPAAAWSRLGTEDVHSLAFVAGDPSRLLFGHHGGVLASADGGRTWQPLGSRSDAMSLGVAAGGSIIVAGHDVLSESRDGGRTWQDIPAQLPSLDIHGFARDPADPARMWALLATGGFWESRDGGRAWELVTPENVMFPIAISAPTGVRLVGAMGGGLASSDDGGRTWRSTGTPALYPMTSLAATPDGAALVAGGLDGLARSIDGGVTWSKLPFEGQPFAIAVTDGGQTIALVTRTAEFFRSGDGGISWPAPP